MGKGFRAKQTTTSKAKKEKQYEVWLGENDEVIFKNLTEMNGCILQLLKKWQANLNPKTAKIRDVINKNSFTNYIRNIPYSSREPKAFYKALFTGISVNWLELSDDEYQDIETLLNGLMDVLDYANKFKC